MTWFLAVRAVVGALVGGAVGLSLAASRAQVGALVALFAVHLAFLVAVRPFIVPARRRSRYQIVD